MHVLDNGASSDTHKCEDLENGWLRVYVDASALSASVDNVSKIYMTFNASDGSGTLTLNFDNLHFEEIPQVTKYTITFKDYDGRVISSEKYEEGATVTVPENPTRAAVAGESEYIFTGWDYEVTTANCDATYTAVYAASNIIDLFNCKIENGGIDTITNDSEVKSENSTYSLKLVEPITSGNLPYMAIELDKSYDLSGKYIVFDFKDIDKTGWVVGFDFVNNGGKLGLWNMHVLDNGASSDTHKCEDLENGWLRVYVDASALSASVDNVSKIYMTFNAADGSGTLTLNFDNLHFEDIPQVTKYTITFKDYDGRVISSEEYEEGATVTVPENPTRAAVAGESEYIFTGWDYEVTTANCDATYTAVYAASNIIDLFNCKIENGGIDTITNDSEVKSENSTYSLKLVEPITSGNLPYMAIELDKSYDLSGKYIVFDFKDIDKTGWVVGFDFVNNGGKLGLWNMHVLDNGASSDTHKCEDLGNGWLRVYVDANALKDSLNNVSKIYMTFNASDGNGTLTLNFDNLHFEDKSTETQA